MTPAPPSFLRFRDATDIPPALLLAVNVIPLIGVIWLGWDVRGLMLLYWSENLIIGAFTIVKMLVHAPLAGLFGSAFFVFHYGGFCAVHGLFILIMTGTDADAMMTLDDNSWPFFLVFIEILFKVVRDVIATVPPIWFFAFGALVVSHGASFVVNFFVRRERHDTHLKGLMGSPYVRVVILHITIIAGAFAVMAFGSTIVFLVLLVILKTGVDLAFHLREHRDRKPSTEESVTSAVPTAIVLFVVVLSGCAGGLATRTADPSSECLVVTPEDPEQVGDVVTAYAARPEVRASLVSGGLFLADCRGAPATDVAQSWSFPEVRMLAPTSPDERDVLDGGVDVLVTRSPEAIDYARRDTSTMVGAMTWDRAYVLVGREPVDVTNETRGSMAAEAVRADARSADVVGWLQSVSACESRPWESEYALELVTAGNVVYEGRDDVAADIAARLVSLFRRGLSGVSRNLSAKGVGADEFDRRLAEGFDAWYVVALPAATPDACGAWTQRFGRAAWIEPDGLRVLLETRDHVIVRRGDVGILLDASGLPHVVVHPPVSS